MQDQTHQHDHYFIESNRAKQVGHPIQWFALGIATGALAAFIFDPQRGRRRRALFRDQLIHLQKVTTRQLHSKSIHFGNVLKGWQVELNKPLQHDRSHNDEAQIPLVDDKDFAH